MYNVSNLTNTTQFKISVVRIQAQTSLANYITQLLLWKYCVTSNPKANSLQ